MITISIPEEVYTMEAKRSIIKTNASLYRKASKKQKKEILDDLEKVLHLNRQDIQGDTPENPRYTANVFFVLKPLSSHPFLNIL